MRDLVKGLVGIVVVVIAVRIIYEVVDDAVNA
jgi:hypothetical protein